LPELNAAAPLGTVVDETVCGAVSSFVHFMLAFTPITTVTLSGEYPGAFAGLDAPFGIETTTVEPAPAEVVVVVTVEVAPPGRLYDELVAIPVTRKYPSRIGIIAAITPITPSVSFGGPGSWNRNLFTLTGRRRTTW
jgi:hypothetical protein